MLGVGPYWFIVFTIANAEIEGGMLIDFVLKLDPTVTEERGLRISVVVELIWLPETLTQALE